MVDDQRSEQKEDYYEMKTESCQLRRPNTPVKTFCEFNQKTTENSGRTNHKKY